MKGLLVGLMVLGLCLVGTSAFAVDYLTLNELGYTQAVVNDNISQTRHNLNPYASFCVDYDGNFYFVIDEYPISKINKISDSGILTEFARIDPNNVPESVSQARVNGIAFDISGNMFVTIEYFISFTNDEDYRVVKISGFTPLSEADLMLGVYNELDGLQSQINTIELTPGPQGLQGPQGDPGISSEDLAAMQAEIAQNRYLLEQLPQLKKKLEELESQTTQ